MGVLTVVVVRQ
ncbi:hypothetical protein VCCP1035_1389A, partial [Vibrio cholerae CP1035(8)]